MIRMQPIEEPLVLESLDDGRFGGPLRGYVIMNGPEYLGHCLFRVRQGCTWVLEAVLKDPSLLDGAVRAAVAAGENAGAERFCVNEEQPELRRWKQAMFPVLEMPIENGRLFHLCG